MASTVVLECDLPLNDLLDFLQIHYREMGHLNKHKLCNFKDIIQEKLTYHIINDHTEPTDSLIRLISLDSYVAIKELIGNGIDPTSALEDSNFKARLKRVVFSKQPGEDELMWLLYLFPDKNWNWEDVYNNPNFYPDRLSEFGIEHKLNYSKLDSNPNLTIAFLRAHQSERWDWFGVSANDVFTASDILNNLDLKWNPLGLAKNKNLNSELLKWCVKKKVKLNLRNKGDVYDRPWYFRVFWEEVSKNHNISIPDIKKYIGKSVLFLEMVSLNPSLTVEDVLKNPEPTFGGWNWRYLSRFLKMSPTDIEKLPPELNYNELSENEGVPLSYITTHKEYGWYWERICRRSDLTLEFIRSFLKSKISDNANAWLYLSANSAVPWWFIRETIQTTRTTEVSDGDWQWIIRVLFGREDVDYEWLYGLVGDRVKTFDWSFAVKNPAIPLSFFHIHGLDTVKIYQNPNLTVGYVLIMPSKNFPDISSNLFTKTPFRQKRKALLKVREFIEPQGLSDLVTGYYM